MPLSDQRFIALRAWIARTLGADAQIVLISGDASFRRYFRVSFEREQYIAMDSPPDLIAVTPFISLAEMYQYNDIYAPQVIEKDIEQGFLLLSDLGDTQLLSVLNLDNVSDYYQRALELLNPIASITESGGKSLPLYDDAFVERELAIFSDWLIVHHLGLTLAPQTQSMLDDVYQLLVSNVREQPKVGMHRDYHSRNLMLCDNKLAVIDFQDAVIGPITYDAVSLLRDCYVRWPDDVVESLMQSHYQQMKEVGLLANEVTLKQYRRWFDLMGIQRHLKAAGIFCRLNYRDGKPGYMKDIPLTLQYIKDVAKPYPELARLVTWLDNEVIPLMETQS
ncbi:aminoglycoside phosphotransferase family protein [Shewanella psychrotolerans]|uniref:aminoglycoside phosphotransferase family protein n=1 Tax=Shewanella psychrotolerans TaxID=2864206 RepID=UPI001C65E55D|nr:phosphotransferase [Shewanella psychrotolerans]QYK02167.1 phosphotransferase [Shewanella psychrotolerans]